MSLIKLDLGRNCLKYIIKSYGIKEIFVPYYICPMIVKAVQQTGCRVKFYHIDSNFMPKIEFGFEDYILYVNYYGINFNNCDKLSKYYKNLIIDNSHAFYAPHRGLADFNSLRKFFLVQNGAYLHIQNQLKEDIECDRTELQPVLFHQDYERFVKNELELNSHSKVCLISPYVENYMAKLDFGVDKLLRLELFKKYHQKFQKYNNIKINLCSEDIPYCYPLSPSNEKLSAVLAEKFCLLRLWKDLPESFCEYNTLNSVIALPLNDRVYASKILNTVFN